MFFRIKRILIIFLIISGLGLVIASAPLFSCSLSAGEVEEPGDGEDGEDDDGEEDDDDDGRQDDDGSPHEVMMIQGMKKSRENL